MWLTDLFSRIFKQPPKEVKKKKRHYPLKKTGFHPPLIDEQLKNQLWAVGGGKGGVGKSLITVMLGASLTRWRKKVILVDADLGGCNLNLLTGIKYPPCTLHDFMEQKVEDIKDIAIDTPVDNLKVICGADGILGLANPKNSQKVHLLNHLKKLEADVILLDLGAGTSFNTLDFFLFAPNRIVLLSPQSTSLQNAYSFVKTCLLRKLSRDFRGDLKSLRLISRCSETEEEDRIDTITKLRDKFSVLGQEQSAKLSACIDELDMGLVVNMVKEHKDINLGRSLISVTNEYLTLNPEFLGYIEYDKRVEKSVNNMGEFLKDGTTIMTEMGFYDLSNKIIKKMYKKPKIVESSDRGPAVQIKSGKSTNTVPRPSP